MKTAFTTYLLALEVAPMAVGQSYQQLPMHCTIMHRFHSALGAKALVTELGPIITRTAIVELLPQNHQAFGPKKQLVTIVDPTPALLALHAELYQKLNQLGVQYTESDWVGEGYIGHVTDKQGGRLPVAKPTLSKAIYLISVEHPLQGSRRFIEARIALASNSDSK